MKCALVNGTIRRQTDIVRWNPNLTPLKKTCIWGKHSFGILRPSTYQIWMMPNSNYIRFFQNPRWRRRPSWKLGKSLLYRDCTICFHLRDYNYIYLQYLTSQIFGPSFLNDIRDKNRHFIIFWCQMWKIVIYFRKNILWFYWTILSNQ